MVEPDLKRFLHASVVAKCLINEDQELLKKLQNDDFVQTNEYDRLLQEINSSPLKSEAESKIVLVRLDEDFKSGLLKFQTPIGHLWFQFRLETFKEIIESGKESANELSSYFIDTEPKDQLVFRTYRVFYNRKPIMMITEKFPQSYFM
jgi:chorismate-pyruvate lyase